MWTPSHVHVRILLSDESRAAHDHYGSPQVRLSHGERQGPHSPHPNTTDRAQGARSRRKPSETRKQSSSFLQCVDTLRLLSCYIRFSCLRCGWNLVVDTRSMEGSRKRKATNATPSTSEGSASKKLRLLVRCSFILPHTVMRIRWSGQVGTHLDQIAPRRGNDVVLKVVVDEEKGKLLRRAEVSSMGGGIH